MATESGEAPAKRSWRYRILPRSVLGLSALILSAALGAAFSGTVLYAYYEYRLTQNEKRVDRFIGTFDKRYKAANDAIDAEREDAKKQIRDELEPLKKLSAEGTTLEELVKKVAPSTWFVHTLDEAGQPSVGSAFVVASDGQQTLLVTDFATVRAATRQPGPVVMARNGDQDLKATLWTWQEDRDLALLIVAKGDSPKLTWASGTVKTGERVFAVSGLGASGGSVTQGFVSDVSANGIQSDTPIGAAFQGGPLVNSNGEVVAVASRSYSPLGFAPGEVTFAVPIRSTCDRILKCPSGAQPTAPAK
jgi:S1-C subfamily serine protease